MAENNQSLPAGLGGVPPASTPNVPGAPAGSSVIHMPNPVINREPAAPAAPMLTYEQYQAQFTAQQPAVAPSQVPPPLAQNPNPMLTTLQPMDPPPAPGAPAAPPAAPLAPPTPPVVPEPPKETPAPGTVADLAGALGSDPAIAPGIAYLEAASNAAGLDTTRAFGNAADELDARFIDKAYLIEKVGQEQADQMIKVATASIEYAKVATEKLYSDVRASAGGDEAWGQAIALFNQHAPKETKVALGALFDSMNKEQMVYAAQQVVAFAKGTGGVINAAPQPLGTPGAVQGMSMEAYRAAIAALPRNAPESAYTALREQRTAGKAAGL